MIIEIDNIDAIFPKETEIYFYRIIQESLNNIIKHSKAQNVSIKIAKALLFVTIDIEDDGVGFEINKITSTETQRLGFGLLNLDERIRLINGTYKFSSEINKGTKLHITIPLKKRNK